MEPTSHVPTIIIGGGQGGLALARELAVAGMEYLVLEAHPRVGESWRARWDSL